MSAEDLEKYETEMELTLYREYRDVVGIFKYVVETDRRFYAAEYARPGGMRAGFEYFRAFEQDAKDFASFEKTKLTMPMLVLSGEKAGGQFLITQGKLVDSNVEGVIVTGSGHWLVDEAPDQTLPKLVAFFNP